MRRISFCSLLFLLLVNSMSIAQDSQFSQFLANPLHLNPALTGSHSGTFRLIANYRDQWSGPLERAFTTRTAGGDIKFNLKKAGSYANGNDVVAVGLQFYSDRVALFDYNTTQLSVFGAFHKMLEKRTNQFLSVGVQFGIAQRGLNYENISFQDQFNGVDLYNGTTAEILPANSVVNPDLSLGLHYSISPAKNTGIYAGVSFKHWNSPNISFFDNDDLTTEEYEAYNLDSRLTFHLSTSFPFGDFAAIEPRVLYSSQGAAKTVMIGSNIKYELSETDGINTHLGAWLRSSKGLSVYELTDLIISAGFEKGGLLFGISYDTHLRKFSSSQFGTGTLEFSISYIGEHDNESRICPVF